ncbi:unnamed protein product [Closterium sp. NIES-53]
MLGFLVSLSSFTRALSGKQPHLSLIIAALLFSSPLPASRTLDAAAPRLAVAQGGEAASLKAAYLVEAWSEAYGLGGDSVLPPSAVSLPPGVPAAPHLEDCARVIAEREAWERRGEGGEEPAWTRGAPRQADAAAGGGGDSPGCSGQAQGEEVPQPPWDLPSRALLVPSLIPTQIRGPDEANLPLTRVVQRDIWRSQFPPGDCTDRRLLVAHWAKSTSHGVGSQASASALAHVCGVVWRGVVRFPLYLPPWFFHPLCLQVHWWRAQAVRFIMRWPSAHLCHVINQERHRAFSMLAANHVARFLHTQSEALSSLYPSTTPAAASATSAAASAAPTALNFPANASDWEARRRRAADRLAALAGSSLSFHPDATGSATGGGDNANGTDASRDGADLSGLPPLPHQPPPPARARPLPRLAQYRDPGDLLANCHPACFPFPFPVFLIRFQFLPAAVPARHSASSFPPSSSSPSTHRPTWTEQQTTSPGVSSTRRMRGSRKL